MKSKTILRLIGVALLFLFVSTQVMSQSNSTWTLMQSESGLDIYYQEYTNNSSNYLKFKFVNSTASSVDFDWTLIKESFRMHENANQVIQANNEVVVDETIYEVILAPNDNISSFYFEINPN